ncbi:MAG: ribonuclease P protein component [Porticoccaceae bacterium]
MPIFKFKKTQRLLNASDYKQVFDDNRVKVANSSLLILAKPADGLTSRLGLVVAKKNIPTAVQRNRIKRIARETFRKNQFHRPLDIVFMARQDADKLSAQKLTGILEKSWAKLDHRCKMLGDQSA